MHDGPLLILKSNLPEQKYECWPLLVFDGAPQYRFADSSFITLPVTDLEVWNIRSLFAACLFRAKDSLIVEVRVRMTAMELSLCNTSQQRQLPVCILTLFNHLRPAL